MTRETRGLEPLYSVTEAARMLGGVSRFTIYAWMNRGLLERTTVGGRVMVRESSLLKLLQQSSGRKAKSQQSGGPHASE